MELTPLISSFIILLREGFEAMLIAMLVFMYLDKVKARHKRPAVFLGMGAGVLVSLLIAVGFKQFVGLTGAHEELFEGVRGIHFKSYLYYLYFNIGRLAYLQANVLAAYIFLAPAIVAGVMTLGVMQQIIRAFGRVEGSLQYLFRAWPTIIELASVYKRLREFEKKIKINLSEIEEGKIK